MSSQVSPGLYFSLLCWRQYHVNAPWPSDAIWHQTIIWTSADLSSIGCSAIHLKAIALVILMKVITTLHPPEDSDLKLTVLYIIAFYCILPDGVAFQEFSHSERLSFAVSNFEKQVLNYFHADSDGGTLFKLIYFKMPLYSNQYCYFVKFPVFFHILKRDSKIYLFIPK